MQFTPMDGKICNNPRLMASSDNKDDDDGDRMGVFNHMFNSLIRLVSVSSNFILRPHSTQAQNDLAQMRMLRWMCGKTRKDGVKNKLF